MCGHSNQCRQVVVGWVDFSLSQSKCTVSARILHGFKTCKGCKSLQNRTKGAETRSSKPAIYRKETTLKRNFQKLRESPGVRYESVGRGFESLPSHQEKPEHVCVLVFLFVSTMEGARTGRRRIAPQAISPVGCCLARGFQRVGMSTVEAVDRKISWLFCFVSHGCAAAERVRLISRRFKTEKMKFHIDKTSRQVYNRTWKQQGITAKSVRMPLWIETG